jgi:hypothetical protein
VNFFSQKSSSAVALRFAATLALLALIGWSAWRSIPGKQIHLSDAEFAINRKLAREARFLSPPTAISHDYLIGMEGLQLPTDGIVRYDLVRLNGFFRGVFQVADKTGGKVEVRSVRRGHSTLLFERTLVPARQDFDQSAFSFLINLAALPPGTEQLLLITANGTVNWREAGFMDEQTFAGFANIPVDFLLCDGYSPPAWLDKVMLLQSPTRLDLRIPAGHHRLSFRCGINPSLFKDPNAFTDGIGFKVELVTSTETHELASRLLEPFSRQSDRELQTISVDWNLIESGRLRLSATPGPASNVAWDWSIWQDFRLETIDR